MQIKTTMRHPTPIKIIVIKSQQIINVGKDIEKRLSVYSCWKCKLM